MLIRALAVLAVVTPFACVTAAGQADSESRQVHLQNGLRLPALPPGYDWQRTLYWSCEDTQLSPEMPEANFGAAEVLRAGQATVALIRFSDLNRALGPHKKVEQATLVLHPAADVPAMKIAVYPLMADWGEGAGTGQPWPWGACFNARHSASGGKPLLWASPGAAGESDCAKQPSATVSLPQTPAPPEGAVVVQGLEADVQRWLDRHYTNFGWVIRADGDESQAFMFHSGQARAQSLRPELVVTVSDLPVPPNDADLAVTYIERLPEYYRYDPGADAYEYKPYLGGVTGLMNKPGFADTQKWPNPGEEVRFIGHVKNHGQVKPIPGFRYRWLINDEVVGQGTLSKPLAPGEEVTVSMNWNWEAEHSDHRDQTVILYVEPALPCDEVTLNNNQLTDCIEALSMGFYVEKSFLGEFHPEVNGLGSYGFEDWLQWQLQIWNEVWMARSRYPVVAPDGSRERVRAQRITIVEDGALAGGVHVPGDKTNFLYDGEWGFAWNQENPKDSQQYIAAIRLHVERGFLHESSHQIGLNDLYVMNIDASLPNGDRGKVHLTAGTGSVITRGMIDPYGGLMGGGDTRPHRFDGPLGIAETPDPEPALDAEPLELYSSEDVGALNTGLGYRRGFFGEFMYDLPERIFLRFVNPAGDPIPGAKITIYQERDGAFFDDPPVMELETNQEGVVLLPDQPTLEDAPFTVATGHTLRPNPWGRINVVGANGVFMIRVEADGQTDWQFVKIHELNLAYWRGNRDSFVYDVRVRIAPAQIDYSRNLAVGASARDSRGSGEGGNAARAIDGDLSTHWFGNNQLGSYLEVELPEAQPIAEVRLRMNGQAGDFWRAFKIELSPAGEFAGEQELFATEPNWQWTVGHKRDVEPKNYDLWTVFYRNRAIQAHFLRITCLREWGARLSELEVYPAQ